MKESDQKFIADWEESKKLGWVKYSLIYGFAANLVCFVLNGLLSLDSNTLMEAFLSQDALIRFLISLPLLILGQGLVMWPIYEWTYQRKIKEEKDDRQIPILKEQTNTKKVPIPKKASPFIIKESSFFSKK